VEACGEKKEGALSVASSSTRWGRSNRGPTHRGRSRESFRDADVKRKEQSRDVAAAYHFAAPPVFLELATTTSPTQCERHRSRLSLSSSLVSTLC
jgi:hypothetical protein